jgi:hypothetical protein
MSLQPMYIFMMADVASLVSTCGAEPFNHHFFSDHCGLYIDLQLSGLFDRNLSPLDSPTYQDICSGNSTLIRKYISTLMSKLDSKDVQSRNEALQPPDNHSAAKALDNDVTLAMLEAGQMCSQSSRLPVSPSLHAAQTKHRIFQQVLTPIRTHRDMSVQIQRRQLQLDTPIILSTDLQSATAALRSARRDIRDLS